MALDSIPGRSWCYLGSSWAPRRLQDGQDRLQDASKTAKDASKRLPDASKTAKIASKIAQDASKRAPDGSKTTKIASKTSLRLPKKLSHVSRTLISSKNVQMFPRDLQMNPRRPISLPRSTTIFECCFRKILPMFIVYSLPCSMIRMTCLFAMATC